MTQHADDVCPAHSGMKEAISAAQAFFTESISGVKSRLAIVMTVMVLGFGSIGTMAGIILSNVNSMTASVAAMQIQVVTNGKDIEQLKGSVAILQRQADDNLQWHRLFEINKIRPPQTGEGN